MHLLMLIYCSYQSLSAYDVIDDSVCVTKVTNLSLQEYVAVSKHSCDKEHEADCVRYSPMIQAANRFEGANLFVIECVQACAPWNYLQLFQCKA